MSLKICFAILLLSLVSTRVLDIDDSNYEAITYPHNFTFISFQNDKCPQCGSNHIDRLRRVTGYLTGNFLTAFNDGKIAEVYDRAKHTGVIVE